MHYIVSSKILMCMQLLLHSIYIDIQNRKGMFDKYGQYVI